jgi:hypothetical protein
LSQSLASSARYLSRKAWTTMLQGRSISRVTKETSLSSSSSLRLSSLPQWSEQEKESWFLSTFKLFEKHLLKTYRLASG